MKHGRPDYNGRIVDLASLSPEEIVRLYDQVRQQPAVNPIRSDEPVFLLRATDKVAPSVVREYARQLRQVMPGGSPMWKASDAIIDVAIAMEEWQNRHGAKLPDVPPTPEAAQVV